MCCNVSSDLDVAYKVVENSDVDIEKLLSGCDPNGIDIINLDNVPHNERLWGQIRMGVRII